MKKILRYIRRTIGFFFNRVFHFRKSAGYSRFSIFSQKVIAVKVNRSFPKFQKVFAVKYCWDYTLKMDFFFLVLSTVYSTTLLRVNRFLKNKLQQFSTKLKSLNEQSYWTERFIKRSISHLVHGQGLIWKNTQTVLIR